MTPFLGYGAENSYKKLLSDFASAVLRLKKEAIRTWKAWTQVRKRAEELRNCPSPNCDKTYSVLNKCTKVKLGNDLNTEYTVLSIDSDSHTIEFDPPLTAAVGKAKVIPIYLGDYNSNMNEN